MKPTTQHIHGQLLERNGRYALHLLNHAPQETTADSLYLRYALITLGREEHIFPAELLDDWGGEIKGLKLYQWIYEFGDEFPRAELFGFDRRGNETQYFLRDLEIHFKLPCYVYSEKKQAIAEGIKIDTIVLPDQSATIWQKSKAPAEIKRPLKSAAVTWWQAPADLTDLAIIFGDKPEEMDS